MHREQLRNINPNHLYGCHPLDLRSYFGDFSFWLIVKKPKNPFPPISPRLRLLELILGDISRSDLSVKDYFSEYMHQKYRRNCKSNTLRQAAGSLIQFLSFYRDKGKQHLEQMTREVHFTGIGSANELGWLIILCKNYTILPSQKRLFCNILNHLIIFIDFFSIFNYKPSELFKSRENIGNAP